MTIIVVIKTMNNACLHTIQCLNARRSLNSNNIILVELSRKFVDINHKFHNILNVKFCFVIKSKLKGGQFTVKSHEIELKVLITRVNKTTIFFIGKIRLEIC